VILGLEPARHAIRDTRSRLEYFLGQDAAPR
jgi:hypothetical protein